MQYIIQFTQLHYALLHIGVFGVMNLLYFIEVWGKGFMKYRIYAICSCFFTLMILGIDFVLYKHYHDKSIIMLFVAWVVSIVTVWIFIAAWYVNEHEDQPNIEEDEEDDEFEI